MNLLWVIVVILILLWLVGGFVVPVGSGLIHILVVLAVVVVLYEVFVGRRRD